MKLHYFKILLLFLPLNILVTSYHEHTKNKPSITPHHTATTISRLLSECDIQSSNYNNDEDIKSVKEIFERQTTQRFQEYEERMKGKRQKRKEQRDKNIQKIIEKYRMEKSLSEKIERGCLRCGCALGGGVLPVWGLVSGLWYAALSQHVTKGAIQEGIKKGLQVGIDEITKIVRTTRNINNIPEITVTDMLSSEKFSNGVDLFDMFEHISTMSKKFKEPIYDQFWIQIEGMVKDESIDMFYKENSTHIAAVTDAFEKCKAAEFASHTSLLSNTIIASVVTILLIVLVMIIIYLILRYRRKKKMKKKAQYTKLLKE
ncbi:rifin PIR protein,putative [Plasmodium sp. DRC-Itaito]|nr:rifin PIR protein,putative [Plasmodium sp. DRC-Itaito]